MEPTSPSHLVAPLVRFARSRGAALELGALGLPDEPLEAQPVTAKGLGALLDAIAAALDEPHLGLLLPRVMETTRYELPELAARSSATFRDGLLRLGRYAPLINSAVAFGLTEESGVACFTHRTPGHPRGVSRHLNEFAMAMGVHGCRVHTGLTLPVREVCFINPRPRSLDRLAAYFGTSALHFGRAENALRFDARVLDAVQATADARLLATAEGLAEAALQRVGHTQGFTAHVERTVREQLEAGAGQSVRTVALALRMSTRTLQRRLETEGTRYAEVVDSVREQLARALVAAQAPTLSEIAFQLGFAEFATFSRAFKRWTGTSPGAFRQGR